MAKKNPDPFTTTRYNSQMYVDQWLQGRTYPRIHGPITDAAVEYLPSPERAGRVLDIGCSTGLLGRRLADLGYDVRWADRDDEAVGRGVSSGIIDADRLRLGVLNEDTWPEFIDWAAGEGIRTLIARRVLCVISQRVPVPMLREGLDAIGIDRMLLEGQRRDVRSKHPFGSADQQVAGLEPVYGLTATAHIDVRYLTRY